MLYYSFVRRHSTNVHDFCHQSSFQWCMEEIIFINPAPIETIIFINPAPIETIIFINPAPIETIIFIKSNFDCVFLK